MASLTWFFDGTYTRKQLRQLIGAAFGGKPSTRPLGAQSGITSPVTLAATSTTWTVGSFTAILDVETDATMGPSPVIFDGNTTGSVTAASSSFDRYDLLSLTMADPATLPTLVYTAGLVATTLPAVPANSIAFAQITVPRTGTGSPTITLLATRGIAAGGVLALPTSTSALPTTPYDGQLITDPKNGVRRYDAGSAGWAQGLTVAWKGRDVAALASLPDSAFANIGLDTLDVDTAGVGIASGHFVAPCDGVYQVSGSVAFSNNVNGYRVGRFTLNGAAVNGSQSELGTNPASPHGTFLPVPTTLIPCSQGDVIALQALQDSGGGTLPLGSQSSLSIVKL